jgi:hypothetical protein
MHRNGTKLEFLQCIRWNKKEEKMFWDKVLNYLMLTIFLVLLFVLRVLVAGAVIVAAAIPEANQTKEFKNLKG